MILNPHTKFLLDTLPIAVFFIGYKIFGIFIATAAMLALTLLILAILYFYERKIALAPLVTAIVVAIFGGLTLWLHDETFIKIKPTLVNLIFSAVLLIGCLRGKGLLRYVLGPVFRLTPEGWYVLSRRWGWFFLCMAALNELVWRNFPTDTWVNFKVFGLFGLTMLFAVLQTRLIRRHMESGD